MTDPQPATPPTQPTVHGSVRGLRTFRVTHDGLLAPVTNRPAWSAGTNTAVCQPLGRHRHHGATQSTGHSTVPAPGCACGLWACGSLPALREAGVLGVSRVLAVVSAHGQVLPATSGFRAQHAHIEALWLSPRIPTARRAAVARAYPATAVYRSKRAMLSEHTLSDLAAYRLPPAPRFGALLATLIVLALTAAGLAGLWLTTDVPTTSSATAGAPTSVATPGGLALVATVVAGHYLAATAALLLTLHPRRWRLAPATLVVQVALLAVGQVLLDDADAWVQLGMAAVATAAMHLGACAVMAWRLRCASHDLHG